MATLTKIGNSKGIRIPKPIIEQAGLEGKEIVFEVTAEGLLLKPVSRKPREGWAEDIEKHRNEGEDPALLRDWADEKLDEWEW